MCSRLLKALVVASEKAANVARLVRQEEHLFDLLVQEKTGDSANSRFVRDFKTLADVLIQEMVRRDIGAMFPELKENIRGEEESTFTNAVGETLTVEIQADVSSTADLLEKVLDSDSEAALLLAEEVHRTDVLQDYDWSEIDQVDCPVDMAGLGIWIDPIDATAEYISGKDKTTRIPSIKSSGLECVTVLLGVYETEGGTPVMGVINRPFAARDQTQNIHWGLSMNGQNANNVKAPAAAAAAQANQKTVAVVSVSEDRKYIYYLRDTLKYDVIFSAGAGHKLLMLILGHADLFLVSKGSTYLWDTCAPHAIIRSMGGNLINLKETMERKRPVEIHYQMEAVKCNFGGVLGFRTQAQLLGFSKLL